MVGRSGRRWRSGCGVVRCVVAEVREEWRRVGRDVGDGAEMEKMGNEEGGTYTVTIG